MIENETTTFLPDLLKLGTFLVANYLIVSLTGMLNLGMLVLNCLPLKLPESP